MYKEYTYLIDSTQKYYSLPKDVHYKMLSGILPKKKVFTPAKVTAVDKDEEKKKKDKKPRRLCKGWSNHGMLGKRGYS